MTSLRRFVCADLFKFNNVNLDYYTETYNVNFYLQYLVRFPEYFYAAESPSGKIMGYIMGKFEGKGEEEHGHVTAVTVDPLFRRVGVADRLMAMLEYISEKTYDGYFVDLFVRKTNDIAINMYTKMGYVVYRRVIGYYADPPEDSYDMRKALPRDKEKKSIIPLKDPVYPSDL